MPLSPGNTQKCTSCKQTKKNLYIRKAQMEENNQAGKITDNNWLCYDKILRISVPLSKMENFSHTPFMFNSRRVIKSKIQLPPPLQSCLPQLGHTIAWLPWPGKGLPHADHSSLDRTNNNHHLLTFAARWKEKKGLMELLFDKFYFLLQGGKGMRFKLNLKDWVKFWQKEI